MSASQSLAQSFGDRSRGHARGRRRVRGSLGLDRLARAERPRRTLGADACGRPRGCGRAPLRAVAPRPLPANAHDVDRRLRRAGRLEPVLRGGAEGSPANARAVGLPRSSDGLGTNGGRRGRRAANASRAPRRRPARFDRRARARALRRNPRRSSRALRVLRQHGRRNQCRIGSTGQRARASSS